MGQRPPSGIPFNLLEMCEISVIGAAMSRARTCYQTMYMGAPNKRLLQLPHFGWLSHLLDFHCNKWSWLMAVILVNITGFLLECLFVDQAVYPVNFLRNVALNFTKTDYVFLCDIDFIPKPSLYTDLIHIINDRSFNMEYKVRVSLMTDINHLHVHDIAFSTCNISMAY